MSKIIGSVNPVEFSISYSEVNGAIKASLTRPLPFPTVVMILCNVMMQYGAQMMQEEDRRGRGALGGTSGGTIPGSNGNGEAS